MLIALDKIGTGAPVKLNKEKTKSKTAGIGDQLGELTGTLAQKGKGLLVVLQGMDTSGKDSVCRRIFERANIKNLKIVNFKEPTQKEMEHDFLWRIHPHVPGTGEVVVFNRSYYEDILVPEVHGTFPKKIIDHRYQQINSFEELLTEHGTIICKFFLNISKQTQQKRIQERIQNPEKHYKYSKKDVEESKKWDFYMKSYQRIFHKCSEIANWEVIPSDQKWYRDYLISQTVLNRLTSA